MLGIGKHGPLGPRRAIEPSDLSGTTVADRLGLDDAGAQKAAHPSASGGALGAPVSHPGLSAADALAVIAAVEGLGPISLERLLVEFGGPKEILAAARGRNAAGELRAATRDPDDLDRASLSAAAAGALATAAADPEPTLASMRVAGVVPVALGDPAYPRRLLTIELPPRVLFVRGALGALEAQHAVAVVGTRRPTDLGRRTATRIGSALARAGALVVSGLALGIDGVAHEAVVHAGGITVAVIGGGHDLLSPRSHDRLADAIVDGGGAIVSEHAPGTEPTKGTFPRRNRLISGLADAVVVVEAGARSGALLTAAWALEQGRECFLVPGSLEAPQSAGCLAWLRDYAGVARIVAGVPQLLEDLGLPAAAAFDGSASPPASVRPMSRGALTPEAGQPRPPGWPAVALDLPPREGRVLEALMRGAATADEIAAVSGLSIGAVLGGLTGLEEGGIAVGTFGRYRVRDDFVIQGPASARAREDPPA